MADINMMGVDFKLTDDDVSYNSLNDIRLNTVQENLAQAVINRLKTQKGFFTKHPEYGSYLYRLLGMPKINSTLVYAKSVIYEALLQEPRINTIDKIDVKFYDNTTLQIFIQVTTIENVNKYNIVFDYFL